MRKNKKMMALLLSTALLVSGIGAGIDTGKTQAAPKVQTQTQIFKTASDGAIESETATPPAITDETPAPEESTPVEPEETAPVQPEETSPADVEESQTPTPSAIVSESPRPTLTPVPTVTPSAISTNSAVSGTAVYAVGDVFNKGNYTYKVVTAASGSAAGTVKITNLVSAATKKTSLTVQDSIVKDGLTFNVEGIAKNAFKSSTALKKVTIGKNVTYIGVRAFQGIKTLQTVVMGKKVKIIKERAFAGCSGLRTITLPSAVQTIGVKSFYNCTKLKAVYIESKKITTVKTSAFKNNKAGFYVVVPSGKKSLYRSLIANAGASKLLVYTY